jgi:xanthine dehydrogenase molybdopterin-binding subunit B
LLLLLPPPSYCNICSSHLQHRWRKRGLAITPTKFGIAFTKLTYNQGGALVHVYTDGTVKRVGAPNMHDARR